MKIDVVDRQFLKRKSRSEWFDLLATTRVISIRSTDGWDASFPIPPGVRPHDNLLCLTFDDSTGLDDWAGHELPLLFDTATARRIMDFVHDDSKPLVVQCTASISRSGAIGDDRVSLWDWTRNVAFPCKTRACEVGFRA